MSLKIGIVGAGGMASYHVNGFRDAGAEVVAIADLNRSAAEAAAAKLEVGEVYTGLGRMLAARRDLDAVSIITPNKFHKPLAIQALNAGKHVYCEKPPALNAAEAKAMRDTAKRKRRTLMFNFNNRARPDSAAMMDYIRKGAVGRINSAQALWIRRTGIPGFGGWFTTRKLAGGGPVIDLLHMIDLALYFMEYPKPQYVMAQTFNDFMGNKTFKGPWGLPDVARGVTDVEAAAHGFIRFSTGQVLFLRNSWAEMNKREEVSVTFQGSKAGGMVRRLFGVDGLDETCIDEAELYTHENGRPVNRSLVFEADEAMGRVKSATNFAATLMKRAKPLSTADEAVTLMKIIDAVYASAKTGKPVAVK